MVTCNIVEDKKIIDNSLHRIEVKQGLLHGAYHPSLKHINLNIAKQLVKDRKIVSRGISYPVFVDVSRSVSMDKPARDYFASEEATEGLIAIGVLVRNWFQKSIVNFWYKVSKPKIPTRLFHDKKSAIQWLNDFK